MKFLKWINKRLFMNNIGKIWFNKLVQKSLNKQGHLQGSVTSILTIKHVIGMVMGTGVVWKFMRKKYNNYVQVYSGLSHRK